MTLGQQACMWTVLGKAEHGTRPLGGIWCQDPPSFLLSLPLVSAFCSPPVPILPLVLFLSLLTSEGHFPRLCLLPLLSSFCLLLTSGLPWQSYYVINPSFLHQSSLTPTPKPMSSLFLKLSRQPNQTHGCYTVPCPRPTLKPPPTKSAS